MKLTLNKKNLKNLNANKQLIEKEFTPKVAGGNPGAASQEGGFTCRGYLGRTATNCDCKAF
ncbi:hypothetical protein C1E24_06930 [Pseudoalteromonas phenolica]|uniref:Uncharacterized protein n=1 Tax=Pseudoalteromonas phenolica TaxID=161398 RepID=A0A5R9Q618_9GAMM|nr:hypothetical protein [Pseudoalteromonas phenolica]TLX47719.1 hypothetical protein C1E24_06930 [Pseudoalteromonas phenolica]